MIRTGPLKAITRGKMQTEVGKMQITDCKVQTADLLGIKRIAISIIDR